MNVFKKQERVHGYDERVKLTQQSLNKMFPKLFKLAVDGLYGEKTGEALEEFDSMLEEVFFDKRYEPRRGVNLIAVRMSERFTNRFTDFYIVWNTERVSTLRVYPCSTKSGLPRVLNPRWVLGKLGVAVLKEGQY